jgi:hypothetical protein
MMVLNRWMVAAIVVGLASVAPGQSSSHPSKPKPSKPNIVQPDDGAPPDQAVKPDESAPLAQTPNYDPPPPPPPPPDPTPPVKTEAVKPEPVKQEPLRLPTRPMTPEEQELEKDSTRLLILARELKEEVEKAGIDTLSLDALRKAEEIQRLSKSLKERMRLQSQDVSTKQ